MTNYSSEDEEDEKLSSIEEQSERAEALSKLIDGMQQKDHSIFQKRTSLHKENWEINPQTLIYMWAEVLATDDDFYSEEEKAEINKHFDKIFTKEEKKHVLIIWKYSTQRRKLTYSETVELFEKILEESDKRLTEEEKEYMLEYLQEDEEIIISPEENKIETDKIYRKFSNSTDEISLDEKVVFFKELLANDENNLTFEEEQEIISFFVLNDISWY